MFYFGEGWCEGLNWGSWHFEVVVMVVVVVVYM